jgi:hypothetical protein
MADSPEQKLPEDKTGDEESQGQPQQASSADTKGGIEALFSDNIFKVLGIVSIVAWMVSEFVKDAHKSLLFVAIIFGLAEAAYVLGHKILRNRIGEAFCWAVYVICILMIYRNREVLALPVPTNAANSKPIYMGTNAPLRFRAEILPNDIYPPGTTVAGINIEKGDSIVKLEIHAMNQPVKNLDFSICFDHSTDRMRATIIYDVAQISQFPDVIWFPGLDFPDGYFLIASNKDGATTKIPIAQAVASEDITMKGSVAEIWRIHCQEVFHDSTLVLAFKTRPLDIQRGPLKPQIGVFHGTFEPMNVNGQLLHQVDGSFSF